VEYADLIGESARKRIIFVYEDRREQMKRNILVLVTIAITVAIGVVCVTGGAAERVVNVQTWGGDLGESFRANIVKPFEEQTGIKVLISTGMSSDAAAKVRLGAGNPEIDVAMMIYGDATLVWDEGLLDPLDPEEIPNLDDVIDVAKYYKGNEICFVGLYGYVTEIVYRTDEIDKEITSWRDLWDPDFERSVMLAAVPYANAHAFVMIAYAFGADEYNMDPAFSAIKLLAEMGNLSVVYRSDMVPFDVISSGEVWIGSALSFTSAALINAGVPIKRVIPEEGAPISFDGITLVKNCPHPDEAKEFINFMLSKEADEAHSNAAYLIPTNKYAVTAPEVQKYIPTQEEIQLLIQPDDDYIASKKGEWLNWWEEEITPLLGR